MVDQNSSNLDSLETTVDSRPPESYRKYCIANCQDEYNASLEAYQDFDIEDGKERAYTLQQCRTSAWFTRNVTTGKVKIISQACHLRWCPMCSATRRWFLTQEVSKWLATTSQPKFLTLTVAHNSQYLNDQITHLYDSFRKYRKYLLLKNSIKGGVWFFQIHRSKTDDLWHPHLHCVIDSPWLDKYKLSDLWEKATITSRIINIKEVKDSNSMAEYVARYAARPSLLSTLDVPSRLELLLTLHGRRLVGTWGSARSIVLRPSKPPDANDWLKVGNYQKVILTMDTDPKALQIWKAFKNDTELAEDCNILPKDHPDRKLEIDWPRSVLEHEQMYLDFY